MYLACQNKTCGLLEEYESNIIPRVGEYINIHEDWHIIKEVRYETKGDEIYRVILTVVEE